MLGLVHHLWLTWLLIAVGGFSTAPTDIWGTTLRQELIAPDLQGRVSAIAGLVDFLGAPLGVTSVLFSVQTLHWPLSTCFIIFGLVLALGAAVMTQLRAMRTT